MSIPRSSATPAPWGAADDVLEIHGTAALATAIFETAPLGAPLTGQVDGGGNLLLSLDVIGDRGCITELRVRLLGPLEVSDETTSGEASITRHGCSDLPDCQTLYACSFGRR